MWRATDLDLGRCVAVKTLLPGDIDRDLRVRFEREASILAALAHPNLVQVLGAGSDRGRPFTVVELIEGISLREALDTGAFEVDDALAIVLQIADALACAHHAGVIHRDLKPANVMLTPDGTAKLVDFGIARSSTLTTLTQAATVLGTASYLSPEQAQALPLDARSDTYSLGCLLYELLTGRPPFQAPSPVAVAYKHVHEQPVPPSTHDPAISGPLDAVTLCALAKAPDHRYASAADLAADLRRVASGQAPALSGVDPDATIALAAVPGAGATTTVAPAGATSALPSDPPALARVPTPRPLLAGVGLGIVFLVLLAVAAALVGGADEPATVALPDVRGTPWDEAVATLEDLGLAVTPGGGTHHDATAGTVVEQAPLPETAMDEGDEVVLIVSSGPAPPEPPPALEDGDDGRAGDDDDDDDERPPPGRGRGRDR